MKHQDKAQIKLSKLREERAEKRTALTELVKADSLTDEQVEQRDALTGELATLSEQEATAEGELRAAIALDNEEAVEAERVAREEREAAEKAARNEDPGPRATVPSELREFRSLCDDVSLGVYLDHMLNGQQSSIAGREKELRQAYGLDDGQIPWAAIQPLGLDRELEARTDAVTGTPTTIQNEQQRILGRVFTRTATQWLGAMMDSKAFGSGDALYYRISHTTDVASFAAADTAVDSVAATLTPTTLSPRALQAAYLLKYEDLARVRNMEERLRADLRMAMSNVLDKNVLNGDANFPGLLHTLTDPTDPTAVVTFATGVSTVNASIDGLHAHNEMDLRLLLGPATFNLMAGLMTTADNETLTAFFRRTIGGVRASANIPAVAADLQEALLALTGPTDGPSLVCPMWGGLRVDRDQTSVGVTRQRRVSIQFTALHSVAVLRPGSYKQLTFKVS